MSILLYYQSHGLKPFWELWIAKKKNITKITIVKFNVEFHFFSFSLIYFAFFLSFKHTLNFTERFIKQITLLNFVLCNSDYQKTSPSGSRRLVRPNLSSATVNALLRLCMALDFCSFSYWIKSGLETTQNTCSCFETFLYHNLNLQREIKGWTNL